MARDIYQEVTDRILRDMESGTAPWEKSWNGQQRITLSVPRNGATNKPYRGINIMLLWGMYPDARFVTFKQAKDLGGNVKKGEHGHMIVFFTKLDIKDKKTGEDKKIPFLKYYTVFNVSQCEGLNLSEVTEEAPLLPEDTQELVATLKVKLSHGGDKACYYPSLDTMNMPYCQDFKATDAYRATLYHEITHWTGHPTRLDRNLRNSFGSSEYAREELVAELGGAFLCAEYGIPYQTQHASYLANWLQVLKEDKKAIMQAASAAQKAVDFIRGQAMAEDEELDMAA